MSRASLNVGPALVAIGSEGIGGRKIVHGVVVTCVRSGVTSSIGSARSRNARARGVAATAAVAAACRVFCNTRDPIWQAHTSTVKESVYL